MFLVYSCTPKERVEGPESNIIRLVLQIYGEHCCVLVKVEPLHVT
jgi:hypothetical protein